MLVNPGVESILPQNMFSPESAGTYPPVSIRQGSEKDPLVKSPVPKRGGGFPENKGCPHTLPKTTITARFSSAKARSSAGALKPRP